jgi:hypothetical protein
MATNMTSYVRMGVRYGRYHAFGGRFGPGKVHLAIWRREHKQWVISCRFNDVGSFSGYHGEQVDKTEPVTCKKCLKHMEGMDHAV